jgi:hypothetical protein
VLVGLFIVLVGLFTVLVGLFIVLVGLFIVLVGLFIVVLADSVAGTCQLYESYHLHKLLLLVVITEMWPTACGTRCTCPHYD